MDNPEAPVVSQIESEPAYDRLLRFSIYAQAFRLDASGHRIPLSGMSSDHRNGGTGVPRSGRWPFLLTCQLDKYIPEAFSSGMKTMTVGEFKANFSSVLDMIIQGEPVAVGYGRNREKVAVLVPWKDYIRGHQVCPGLLKGKASFRVKKDFKITDEELLKS